MSDIKTSRMNLLRPLGPWLLPAVFVLVAAFVLFRALPRLTPFIDLNSPGFVLACLVGGGLYLLSHLLRAMRLAIIALPMMGIGFRTSCVLHLYVAPWSLLMPFKLDELIRLNELRRTGKTLVRALVSLLIDRTMDGAVLCALSIVLVASGREISAGFVVLLGVWLLVMALAIFLLPASLEALQRYIFLHHYHAAAARLLKLVSGGRGLLHTSRSAALGAAPFLIVTTVGIWLLEILATYAFVKLMGSPLGSISNFLDIVEITLRRADDGWKFLVLGQSPAGSMSLMIFAAFGVLCLCWPAAWWVYRQRSRVEPMRARSSQVAHRAAPPDLLGS